MTSYGGIVYCATHRESGKKYVGQTTAILGTRIRRHLRMAKRGCGAYFHRALHAHGADAFDWVILAECADHTELCLGEKFFIRLWRTNETLYGYNLTEGGNGPSESSRFVSATKLRGRKLSPAHKSKISTSRMGIEPWNKGKKLTPDACKDRARVARARWARIGEAERSREVQRKSWAENTAARLLLSEKAKKRWADPAYRERMRQSMRGVKKTKRTA